MSILSRTTVGRVIVTLLLIGNAHHGWAGQNSPSSAGQIGLISTPSARMDGSGTLRVGGSFSDPYWHGFMGFQISDDLHVNIRQSAEISNPADKPDRFFPGLDFKLNLLDETRSAPQIALGAQSAIGHKRMGGEYIVASKRYHNWDFSAGLGWGRYGSSFSLDNPLKALSKSHFGKGRSLDGDMPMQPNLWFTGDKIGFFGGAQYNVPALDGLSLKFDVGADRYEAEKAAIGYDAAAPWAAGINYQTQLGSATQLDTQIAVRGGDRISARITLSRLIEKLWKKPQHKHVAAMTKKRATTSEDAFENMTKQAYDGEITLDNFIPEGDEELTADLSVDRHYSLPDQVGRAAIYMANNADPKVEKISIIPRFLGLKGPRISVMRRDLELANIHKQGSADEVWANADIKPEAPDLWDESFVEVIGLSPVASQDPPAHVKAPFMSFFNVVLDQQFSLAEEDHAALRRTSFVVKYILPRISGSLDYGSAVRFNLNDNLHHIVNLRPKSLLPVRSDVSKFASQAISLDESYVAYTHSFTPSTHVSLMSGYLEEVYASTGGEILYRPFDKKFAIGAESFIAMKRDPDSDYNLRLTGDRVLTGQFNAYYDLPKQDMTVSASLGRFLGADNGGRIGFIRRFDNGMRLSGYLTLSSAGDPDLYGGTTHSDHGLRLSMPLGGFEYVPDYVSADVRMQPFGRDIGQSINKPIDLYEITDHFSLPHIANNWQEVVE